MAANNAQLEVCEERQGHQACVGEADVHSALDAPSSFVMATMECALAVTSTGM